MSYHRMITGAFAVLAAASFLQCSEKSPRGDRGGKTCSDTQALQATPLRGNKLPPKTVALTFDDGPGPRTKALSSFLKNEGIEAAFFVNGRSMGADAPEILAQLVADGHLIANHTETHQSLTGQNTGEPRPTDAEVLEELTKTDAKIAEFVPEGRFLFRPPYGDFDAQTFQALENSPMNKYVGPVLWDIGDRMDEAAGEVADWDCWQEGTDGKRTPMKECGDLYVTAIKRAGWGIVLLHDPYYNELDPEQEGTVEMVMYMVPILKEAGFNFVRVDRVPEIAALLPPEPDAPTGGDPGTPEPKGEEAEPSPVAADDPCN